MGVINIQALKLLYKINNTFNSVFKSILYCQDTLSYNIFKFILGPFPANSVDPISSKIVRNSFFFILRANKQRTTVFPLHHIVMLFLLIVLFCDNSENWTTEINRPFESNDTDHRSDT